jgi:hypothetical protein
VWFGAGKQATPGREHTDVWVNFLASKISEMPASRASIVAQLLGDVTGSQQFFAQFPEATLRMKNFETGSPPSRAWMAQPFSHVTAASTKRCWRPSAGEHCAPKSSAARAIGAWLGKLL